MAGFSQAEIQAIVDTIKTVLTQGGDRVRFPDGSEVQYPSREKLLSEYRFWTGLLDASDSTSPPSSFVVRTTKGVD